MTISVGMGIAAFPFADAGGFWRWVDLCEAGGVDSIWQSDRLISTAPALECMSVMAALAGRTRRLKFGMNVLSLAQRDPVLVAKQCATIDVLSEGRLLPAFGIGSPLGPEWTALGLDARSRGKRMDESLEIVSRLWREDAVDFDGVHFRLRGASIAPKPVQAELPMWIGGSSDAAIRRTGRYGTGWQAGLDGLDDIARVIVAIKAAAAAAGRSIDEDHYGAGLAFHFGSADEPVVVQAKAQVVRRVGRDVPSYFAIGDAEAILERIGELVKAGVSKFILRPLAGGEAAVLAQTRRLIDEVLPAVAARWPRRAP
ncbi:MAG TPA: LLM class flavin-dependent oxidoreductase [Xanthobacteraceae bacterium]|jgi:probable F420-dependent oxidoreductase|nr:LLM class flavin-dependent oxidoreductase [Xanthobacteraceae bacterium]